MSRLLVVFAACGGAPAAPPDAAPPPAYSHTAGLLPLLPTDAAAFGTVIATANDGATIAVGEVGVVANGQSPIGEVYVFERQGRDFGAAVPVMQNHGAPGDKFGASLAFDAVGEILAVGACGQASGSPEETDRTMPHAGAVYVFRRTPGGAFGQVAFLKTDAPHPSDYLCALAMSGDGNTIAAAAVAEDNAAGAIYVFANDGVHWTQRARLVAPDAQPSERFGAGLALSAEGDVLVAGLPGRASALIYDRSGDAWTLRTTLTGDAGFGEAVALSGLVTTLIVGTKHSASIITDAGRVELAGAGASVAVSRDGKVVASGGPGVPGMLVHPDGSPVDVPAFTGSVALSSDGATLATGAIADHGGTGEAYAHY